MGNDTKTISKQTAISLGVVFVILLPLITGVSYIVNIKNKVSECNAKSEKTETRVDVLEKQTNTMQYNFGKLETKLDYVIKLIEKNNKS